MDAFELDVLGAISDDYESVHTIRSDLERDLGRPVSEGDVGAALGRLAESGFIDVFIFDPSSAIYRRVPVGFGAVGDLWFMINSVGVQNMSDWWPNPAFNADPRRRAFGRASEANRR